MLLNIWVVGLEISVELAPSSSAFGFSAVQSFAMSIFRDVAFGLRLKTWDSFGSGTAQ